MILRRESRRGTRRKAIPGATGSTTNAAFAEYVYFDGERVARRDYQNNVLYYFEDQVNSSRAIVELSSGSGTPTLCYDADFYPYGGEDVFTNTCAQNYKFQGKERDPETGNDYFGARFYSSTYGRFLSADWSSVPAPVPYANLTNPQTLNLYAIVSDNPESFADLNGHCWPPGSCTLALQKDENQTQNQQVQQQTQEQTNIYRLNGVVTVETSTTTTTTDSKGNKVTTVTTTQAFFSAKKGHEGSFLGAHQTTFTENIFNRSQQNLTLAQATNVLGSKAVAAATEATAPGFGGELSRDIQAHPVRYALHVVGLVAGPALGLGDEVDGIITAIHALHTAADLSKESQ